MVKSVSISRTVQNLIDNDLSLQDVLQRGYGNYSAIARMLRPKVEEVQGEGVNLESVITSIKRAKLNFRPLMNITNIVAKSVITIRTDVAKISVEKNKRTSETLWKTSAGFQREILQVVEGLSTITLVFDQKIFGDIRSAFRREDVLDERQNLAAIVVNSPREIAKTPGCVTAFYTAVSRRHINIEETMSCFTETIIIISMKDVGRAFTSLTDLITEARKNHSKQSDHRS